MQEEIGQGAPHMMMHPHMQQQQFSQNMQGPGAQPGFQHGMQQQSAQQAGGDQSAQGGQGAAGGVLSGLNTLTPQEKKLFKEIMDNKNTKDPRCKQRIKEILLQNPKIKEFIMNQSKAQQQS
jgi:hypothetical protein